jgi:ankyrin repeat protein
MVRTWFPDPVLDRLEVQLMEKAQQARQLQALDPGTGQPDLQYLALENDVRNLEEQLHRQYEAMVKAQEETLAAIKAVQKEGAMGEPSGPGVPDEEEVELARLRGLRESSPDRLNAPGEGGLTPLGKAARDGHLDVVDRLLSWGVDPLRKMERGEDQVEGLTALHLAAREGHRAVVLRLLDAGVSANLVSPLGTPLSLAVAREFTGVVELLLERGADPKAEGFAYSLAAAIDSDSPRMVERMVQAGAGLSSLGGAEGKAPLDRALASNRREAARALIRLGAPVEEGMLERALKFDGMDAEWLGELLKAAPAELKESGGLDGLLVSALRSGEGVPYEVWLVRSLLVPAILQAGASPNALITDTHEPVMIYVTRNVNYPAVNHPAFDALLAAGPDLSVVEPKTGQTALHYAVRAAGNFAIPVRLERVRRLLEAGADPNLRDFAHLTPLASLEDAERRPVAPERRGLSTDPEHRQQGLAQLWDLLRNAGAREDVTRRWYLSVKRGDNFERFYVRRSEDAVPLRLAELLTVFFSRNATVTGQLSLHFPALNQLRIHRWAEDGSHEYTVPVAPDWVKQEGCDWNVALEWGDALEIPEDLDRPARAQWEGLSQGVVEVLQRCTIRQVTVEVEGSTREWKLLPGLCGDPQPAVPEISQEPSPICDTYLGGVLPSTGQLRASSDLSRVRVTRPGTGQEWILDVQSPGPMNRGDFWLLDGDRVVVPSKQP